MTYAEWFEIYMQLYKRKLAPKTRESYARLHQLLTPIHGAQLLVGVAQPYRLHDLRHTYATHLVAAGVNPRVLQYMIGHSTLDITMQTYTHIDGNLAVKECSRVGKFLH